MILDLLVRSLAFRKVFGSHSCQKPPIGYSPSGPLWSRVLRPEGVTLQVWRTIQSLFLSGVSSCYTLGIAKSTISAGIIHSYVFKSCQLQSSRGRQLRYCVTNSEYHGQRPSRVLRLQSRSRNLGHTRFDRGSPAGQRSFDFDRTANRSIGHIRRVSTLA
jgi:hypothetical protein